MGLLKTYVCICLFLILIGFLESIIPHTLQPLFPFWNVRGFFLTISEKSAFLLVSATLVLLGFVKKEYPTHRKVLIHYLLWEQEAE